MTAWGRGILAWNLSPGWGKKKTTTLPPEQSSQNKLEPEPTAGHILGRRSCVPSGRGSTSPFPEGLRPLPGSGPSSVPPNPSPAFYRFGFLLGREIVIESLGILPARRRGGLCPWPGFTGLPRLSGFHARARIRSGQAGAGGSGDAGLAGLGCGREARPGREKQAGRAGRECE